MVNNMIRVVITFIPNNSDLYFDACFEFETLDLALSFVNDIAACSVTKIKEFTIYREEKKVM